MFNISEFFKPNTSIRVVLCGVCILFMASHSQSADTVIRGAKIYTVSNDSTWAEAIAVRGGKIIYVGDNSGVEAFIAPATKLIDARDRMILPGFIDSHVHPVWGGLLSVQVNLREAQNVADVQRILRKYRKANPDLRYITGGSWVAANFTKSGPKKEWIDNVINDIPVVLYDHFGHTAWVNSLALKMAGLNKDSPDPEGGLLERDSITGELTGTLREHGAFKLVHSVVPPSDKEQVYKALKSTLRYLNGQGITSFITAYMVGEPLGDVFERLHRNNELTARTMLSFRINPQDDPVNLLSTLSRRRSELEKIDPEFIKANMAKLFLDGVVLSHTAAMLDPYHGKYQKFNSAAYSYSNEQLHKLSAALDENRFQLHFHTVGDGAARQALDTLEHLNDIHGIKKRRAMVSHLFTVDSNDFKRFKDLGVYPNMQFYWTKHNENIAAVEQHFGDERNKRMYPYGTLLKEGANIVAGSDWPVSTASPFGAMQMAATRPYTSLNASVDEVFGPASNNGIWLPKERITSIEAMIRAYTINGAKIQFRDTEIGSLEVGKFADLIMIDRNILNSPVTELHKAKVVMTMVNGKVVFQAD